MENIAQLKDAITKIENNQGEFYFLTINTKGVQKASVAMNYELVRMLTQKGYTAHIMHQEEDIPNQTGWVKNIRVYPINVFQEMKFR